jgi:cell division control protein 6
MNPSSGRDEDIDHTGDKSQSSSSEPDAPQVEGKFLESQTSSIWKDKSLVEPDTIVDENRIVGRDAQVDQLIENLRPVLHGQRPPDLYVYGLSGSGKSLILNLVFAKLDSLAADQGVDFGYVELNCHQIGTRGRAVNRMIEQTANNLGVNHDIRTKGTAVDERLRAFYDLVDDHTDYFIVILDEIDLLEGYQDPPAHSWLLYELTRAEQIFDIDTSISVVAVTNRGEFIEEDIGSRARSSFNPENVVFGDYTADQIDKILRNRDDAFQEGVVKPDVIPEIAEHAAEGHADARIAIDLFRVAGKVAKKRGDKRVTVDHVDVAMERYEDRRLLNQVSIQSPHKQLALLGVALVAEYIDDDEVGVPSPVAIGAYQIVADHLERSARSESSFNRYMNEMETYGVVSVTQTTSGRNTGVYHEISIKLPTAVQETIEEAMDITVDRELRNQVEQYTEGLLDKYHPNKPG